MKRLIVLALACVALAGPAIGEPQTKTQLVTVGGKSVENLMLRHTFNATWVVDNQNVLYRDDAWDYYLVTLKTECQPLDIRHRNFAFQPDPRWRLKHTSSYEVRPLAGKPCEVAKIAMIDSAKADSLRDAASWRAW